MRIILYLNECLLLIGGVNNECTEVSPWSKQQKGWKHPILHSPCEWIFNWMLFVIKKITKFSIISFPICTIHVLVRVKVFKCISNMIIVAMLCAWLSSLLWRFSCMIDSDTFIKLDYQSIEYALQTSLYNCSNGD